MRSRDRVTWLQHYKVDEKKIKWCQSVIRLLMWPAIHTIPDLICLIRVLSQYCSNLRKVHYNLIPKVIRYLARTFDLGLTFCKDSEDNIVGYLELDYAGLIDGRKLTGAYIFIFADGPIFRSSKL